MLRRLGDSANDGRDLVEPTFETFLNWSVYSWTSLHKEATLLQNPEVKTEVPGKGVEFQPWRERRTALGGGAELALTHGSLEGGLGSPPLGLGTIPKPPTPKTEARRYAEMPRLLSFWRLRGAWNLLRLLEDRVRLWGIHMMALIDIQFAQQFS